jgi:hypothetical protein
MVLSPEEVARMNKLLRMWQRGKYLTEVNWAVRDVLKQLQSCSDGDKVLVLCERSWLDKLEQELQK